MQNPGWIFIPCCSEDKKVLRRAAWDQLLVISFEILRKWNPPPPLAFIHAVVANPQNSESTSGVLSCATRFRTSSCFESTISLNRLSLTFAVNFPKTEEMIFVMCSSVGLESDMSSWRNSNMVSVDPDDSMFCIQLLTVDIFFIQMEYRVNVFLMQMEYRVYFVLN